MAKKKWNRTFKKLNQEDVSALRPLPLDKYQPERVRLKPGRKKKPKHAGYTIIPESRLWIFDKYKEFKF